MIKETPIMAEIVRIVKADVPSLQGRIYSIPPQNIIDRSYATFRVDSDEWDTKNNEGCELRLIFNIYSSNTGGDSANGAKIVTEIFDELKEALHRQPQKFVFPSQKMVCVYYLNKGSFKEPDGKTSYIVAQFRALISDSL